MFVNYLEYHIRSGLFLDNQTLDGMELPNGFTTDLFDNISDFGLPELTSQLEQAVRFLQAKFRLKRV